MYNDGSLGIYENGTRTDGLIRAETVPVMIYFIKCLCPNGFIKIGSTINIYKRVAELQAPTPYQLKLVRLIEGPRSAERALHERFDEFRYRGEWFRPGQPILDYIEGMMDHDISPPDANRDAPFRHHKSKAERDAEERARIQEFEKARASADRLMQRRRLAILRGRARSEVTGI